MYNFLLNYMDVCTIMYMNTEILLSLKNNREKAGLTQKDVEKALGMRKLMMRDYEIGRLKLPVSVAVKLSEVYRVSLDELVGNRQYGGKIHQSKVLVNFKSLFLGNGFSMMFLDPIIRAFLEDHHGKYFDYSFFELLTDQCSEKQKKEVIVEINKLLFSVASTDGKISNEEIECIRYLLTEFKIQNKYKEIIKINAQYYPEEIPKSMERIEIRHFTIWILFFFAFADEEICHQEISYIEKCAEHLKINKSNFLFIKKKFVKEGL